MILIRTLDVSLIEDNIAKLCVEANCHLGNDILNSIRNARDLEQSPVGIEILNQLLDNSTIASDENLPVCQDTGFAIVFVELGQDVHLVGGDLTEAINNGVRSGYSEGYLRKSMVKDPLERTNTGDNTPAIIHLKIVPGENVKLTVAPKGGGSENMSSLKMLKPADGVLGVKKFILETVRTAGPNPCPPIVVGVGIGGSMEKAAEMSKFALTRELGQSSSDPQTAKLEQEILNEINELGIGPQGLGGKVTALAVHIEKFATHIACLPVAVNLSCHAYRHKTIII